MIFETHGVRLNYEINGEGAENPILLLHGWGGGRQSWLPVERDLKGTKTIINLDFPGFGASSEPQTGWSVTEYAECVLDLLDSLDIHSVDVIAHSFGGRVTLLMNAMRPQLIKRQLLTGCAGLIDPSTASSKGLSGIYDNKLTRSLLGEKGVSKLRDFARSHFGSADYKAASPIMRETFKKVISQDLEYCLAGINASTLLIWGENDTATPLWMGKKMEATIKDSALIVFENSGHFAYLEQYNRFITVAKQFFGA